MKTWLGEANVYVSHKTINSVYTLVLGPVYHRLLDSVRQLHTTLADIGHPGVPFGTLGAGYKVHFSFNPENGSFPQFCDLIATELMAHGLLFHYKYAEAAYNSPDIREEWEKSGQKGKEFVAYLVDQKKYDAYAALVQESDTVISCYQPYGGHLPQPLKNLDSAKNNLKRLLPGLKKLIVTEEKLAHFMVDTAKIIDRKHTFKIGAGYHLQKEEKRLNRYATLRCDRDSNGDLVNPPVGDRKRKRYLPDAAQKDDFPNVGQHTQKHLRKEGWLSYSL